MFNTRSLKKELLDGDGIPDEDLYQNLRELDSINQLLGGYKITFNALKKVVVKSKPYTLVDIGSGGGDALKRIHKWGKRHGMQLHLWGIDLKPACITYSTRNNAGIQFICDDYKNVLAHVPGVEILHACLFCHHLNEQEIVDLITFCLNNQITLIVNDLERNPIAYYAIKLLTGLFSKSYLVKNDAPLSVLRGFKAKEWRALMRQAGAVHYSIRSKWAFRHQVIVYA